MINDQKTEIMKKYTTPLLSRFPALTFFKPIVSQEMPMENMNKQR